MRITREEGDPAGIATHQLDHHDALVRFGGRVQLVQRVRRGLHRGQEPEGELRGLEVVVDRLRHPDDLEPLLVQGVGDLE